MRIASVSATPKPCVPPVSSVLGLDKMYRPNILVRSLKVWSMRMVW